MESQGYKAVTLSLSSSTTSRHQLFIKEHCVRNYEEDKPSGRTLFILNLPPYTTESNLIRLFSKLGQVTSVQLQDSVPNGFKFAYVVFNSHTTLKKALTLDHVGNLSEPENPIKLGLSRWIEEYNNSIQDHGLLNETVNTFMAKYDRSQVSNKEENADDEGWTVVGKKGRNPGISRKQSVEHKLIAKNADKSKRKELRNFYTFQVKQDKMKHIVALRKSFQESKEKVQKMKQMRNFKPLL